MNIIGNFQTLDDEKLLDSTEINHFSTSAAIFSFMSYLDPLRKSNFGQFGYVESSCPERMLKNSPP